MGATVLAYLDDVATTVTENVVTIPLSTEEVEIVATDLEQGIISSYTFINNVTQTQYADFTIAVPSGVTVSGTTISGEVATETYTITVTPDPVASTVTAKIDNVETTVTTNAFAVPVSATSVEITVVADGYVSATRTYTNEVTQAVTHVLDFAAVDEQWSPIKLNPTTRTLSGTSANNGTYIEANVTLDGATLGTSDLTEIQYRLYIDNAWTDWGDYSLDWNNKKSVWIPFTSSYISCTKFEARAYVDGAWITTPEYTSTATVSDSEFRDSTYTASGDGATVSVDAANKTFTASGASTDTVTITPPWISSSTAGMREVLTIPYTRPTVDNVPVTLTMANLAKAKYVTGWYTNSQTYETYQDIPYTVTATIT